MCLLQVSRGDSVGAVGVGRAAVHTLLGQTGPDIRSEGAAAQAAQATPPFLHGRALVRHHTLARRDQHTHVHAYADVVTFLFRVTLGTVALAGRNRCSFFLYI